MPESVPKGPRKTCPACGTIEVSSPTYCYPSNRAWVSFANLFQGKSPWCEKEGKHLHQQCERCGCSWICTPTEIKA